MTGSLTEIRRDVEKLKHEMAVLKSALDDGELTPWARKALQEARKLPQSAYVANRDVRKRFARK